MLDIGLIGMPARDSGLNCTGLVDAVDAECEMGRAVGIGDRSAIWSAGWPLSWLFSALFSRLIAS